MDGEQGAGDGPGPGMVARAVRAAGAGAFEWDLTTGRVVCDPGMLVLLDLPPAPDGVVPAGSFLDRLDPADRERANQELRSALATGAPVDLEVRVSATGGGARWLGVRAHVTRVGDGADDDGAPTLLSGIALDTTEVRTAQDRGARVLEAIPTAFFALDRRWRFSYVNAEAERVLGASRRDLLGGVVWDLFPAALGTRFEERYRHAAATGEPVMFEEYYPAPLDTWYEVRAWPSGEGLSVYFLDVTARREAQQQAARATTEAVATAERAALGATVTAELSEILEPGRAVARLADLLVPTLADWVVVTVEETDDAGRPHLHDVASAHHDPAARPLVERYAATRLAALADDAYLLRSLRTHEPLVVQRGVTAAVRDVLRPGEARDVLEQLAPESGAVVPMRARGRTLGGLSLFRGASRSPMTPEEIAVAVELAGRAALVLDNARLYSQQRTIAEGFQRSMLTAPPEPDHVEIAVRYHPAAEAAQVGGDWYDAFMHPGGATYLVIGDVTGHDLAAAASMGQVRSVLRGIGATTGAGPAGLLEDLDRALTTLQADVIASTAVVRLEQTPEELRRGVTRVRWSNAGHLDPMLISPDGEVSDLVGGEHDVLLGVAPERDRREWELVVPRGSTVVLYTDGLVERRGEDLRVGIARLRDALAELADLDLETLCDALLARMLPPLPDDDVALLAFRLHPQDGPRPAEAGPNRTPPTAPTTG